MEGRVIGKSVAYRSFHMNETLIRKMVLYSFTLPASDIG
jgi:hypothetical protein